MTEPFDIPVGRLAVVADPFGNDVIITAHTAGGFTRRYAGRIA